MKDQVGEAMGRLGFRFEDLLDEERDAGLGTHFLPPRTLLLHSNWNPEEETR